MILSPNTITELRKIINGDNKAIYRSGPQLVDFFNQFGFYNTYNWGGGFPSRWVFTEDCLNKINGTPQIDECIKATFNPSSFIEKHEEWKQLISEFNQYLAFDGFKLVCRKSVLSFEKAEPENFNTFETKSTTETEESFINKELGEIDFNKLNMEYSIKSIL